VAQPLPALLLRPLRQPGQCCRPPRTPAVRNGLTRDPTGDFRAQRRMMAAMPPAPDGPRPDPASTPVRAPAVEVEHLVKRFGGFTAVDDVSFEGGAERKETQR